MDINLEQYKLFYKVAKCNSFSKAADELYISQPAVTQGIKKLEDSLGGALFYRTNNGIVLTEEGKNLYNFIEESMEVLDNAQEKFEQYKKLEVGKIKLKGANSLIHGIVKKPLLKFLKEYPKIQVDIASGGHIDTLEDLNEGRIDLGVLNFPINNTYKNLQFIEITRKELIFVMSPEYEKKFKVKINNTKDLLKYDIIAPKKGTKYREVFDTVIKNEDNYKYEIMSEAVQIDFAKEGLGIAFVLKEIVEEELKKGELIELNLKNKNAYIARGLGFLKDNMIGFATKKLVEYIVNENKINE